MAVQPFNWVPLDDVRRVPVADCRVVAPPTLRAGIEERRQEGAETKFVDRITTHAKIRTMEPRTVVGWSEYVDLPEWGVRGLKAKVDTGAKTSALHVEEIELRPRGRIRFVVVVHKEKRERHVRVEARIVRRSRVRSSTGHYDYRYFVSTTMQLGDVERQIEVSLVDRERMVFRMLLGRSALAGAFIIDPGRKRATRSRRVTRKASRSPRGTRAR